MNAKTISSTVLQCRSLASTVRGQAARVKDTCLRHRRPATALAAAALLFGPVLVTGSGELFFLNALGLGIPVLLVRRFAARRRRRRSGR